MHPRLMPIAQEGLGVNEVVPAPRREKYREATGDWTWGLEAVTYSVSSIELSRMQKTPR